jgi:hypothetical protein
MPMIVPTRIDTENQEKKSDLMFGLHKHQQLFSLELHQADRVFNFIFVAEKSTKF